MTQLNDLHYVKFGWCLQNDALKALETEELSIFKDCNFLSCWLSISNAFYKSTQNGWQDRYFLCRIWIIPPYQCFCVDLIHSAILHLKNDTSFCKNNPTQKPQPYTAILHLKNDTCWHALCWFLRTLDSKALLHIAAVSDYRIADWFSMPLKPNYTIQEASLFR